MLLVAGLVLLVLRQVMPIAARLAGGVALASHGVMGTVVARGLGAARGGGAYAGRLTLDRAAIGYEAGGRRGATGGTPAATAKVVAAWRVGRGG